MLYATFIKPRNQFSLPTTHTEPEVIFMFISPEGEFYTNGHAQRAKMIFLSLKAHWDVWVSKVVDGSYSKLENPHFLSFRRNHLE